MLKIIILSVFLYCDSLVKIDASQEIPEQMNNTEPLSVEIGFYIESIGGLQPQRMAYDIDIYFRQTWRDWRLNHSESLQIINDLDILKSLWRPDLYFINARKADFHKVTIPNFVMYVEPDGTVAFSSRITLTASCNMKLHRYPMDTQICKLKIGSYAHTTDKMKVTWFQNEAIAINPKIDMPEFRIVNIEPDYCTGLYNYSITKNKIRAGYFSCLEAKIYLHRSIGYHLVQTYIPTGLIVIISFVGFWIDRAAVPARVTLSFTTLLTTTTQAVGVRIVLPPVSYLKAIDVWMSFCLLFVLGGLLEYAAVNSMMRISQRYNTKAKSGRSYSMRKKKLAQQESESANLTTPSEQEILDSYLDLSEMYSLRGLKIDKMSRYIFPISFAVFCFIYWIYYSVTY